VRQGTGLLLHEDYAASSAVLRFVLLGAPFLMLFGAAGLWFSAQRAAAFVMALEAALLGLVFSLIVPRKYQVYEDHVRVVFGGPFYYRIGFDKVKSIEATSETGFTMNLTSTIARSYVRISRTGGMALAITPRSNEEFAHSANDALTQWHRRMVQLGR
jgi:hypothetical protein